MNPPDEKKPPSRGGLSRREFITTMGASAAAAAVSGRLSAETLEGGEVMRADGPVGATLRVNGRAHRLTVEPRWTLLFVLREKLEITGTKPGCERGECGACTVLLDGVPRYACLTLALEAEGAEITTVEGLLEGEELGPVQQAFVEEDAYQCGYCTSGQVVAAEGLLRANPDPSADEIRHGMSGNLCRCGAYPHIARAVERAGELKRGG